MNTAISHTRRLLPYPHKRNSFKDVDLKTNDEASSDELGEESGFEDKAAALRVI